YSLACSQAPPKSAAAADRFLKTPLTGILGLDSFQLSNFYENCSSERMEAQRSETTVATMKTRPMATTKTSLRLCPRCRPRRPRPYPIKSVVVVP
ncbi:hypothetical protein TYRP_006308, partial [Tyrophagus putrescentiae]